LSFDIASRQLKLRPKEGIFIRECERAVSLTRPHVTLLIETSNCFGRGLLQGIARYARTHGPWSIYVDEYGPDSKVPRWLKRWKGHGIIMRARNRPTVEFLRGLGVPIVDTLQQIPNLGLPGVYPDDAAIGRMAARHLIERQVRYFAFVGVEKSNWSLRRRDAFVEELRQHGHRCNVYSPLSRRRFSESWEGGQEDLADWLEELPKPLGLMAAHDLRALCVFDACRRKQLAIPEQIAIVGVDNDDVMCQLAEPPLTSIAHRVDQIGYEAAALLDRLMAGGASPSQPTLIAPKTLVTRRSTDIVAMDDPMISAALKLIRDNCGDKLGVEQIARQVGMSRRALERGFAQKVGRTPHEQIAMEKLQRTKQLLEDTDFTLDTIADKVGMSSAAYLSVFFKDQTGKTPGDFRRASRVSIHDEVFYPTDES
jgi:LacI family transcriptional regulator